MDFTPPSLRSEPNHLSKSASRLARMVMDSDLGSEPEQIPNFSVEFAPSSKRRTPSSMPSKLSCSRPMASAPLHELLLLSPSSAARRSRTRLEPGEDPISESVGSRRRCRARTSSIGSMGCASPRNSRRSRRRLELEVRDEREIGLPDDVAKTRRKRHSGKSSRKEKLSLVVPSTVHWAKENEREESALDGIGELITDLIMWKDVAKSSLWFGFGCLCFLSSCFTRQFSFSIFSAGSKLGLLFLGVSFLSNTLFQRNNVKKRKEFRLTEDDILRVTRVVLPAINLMVSKTRGLFSGEASTTLKVALIFSIGAEYGHLLTLWRLCAIGFFASFSVPKLHSLHATQIQLKVEHSKSRVLECWQSCSHKKIIVASMATAFWNLSSLRTRIFAAFLALVILRYFRQNSETNPEEEEDAIMEEREKLQQALIVPEAM